MARHYLYYSHRGFANEYTVLAATPGTPAYDWLAEKVEFDPSRPDRRARWIGRSEAVELGIRRPRESARTRERLGYDDGYAGCGLATLDGHAIVGMGLSDSELLRSCEAATTEAYERELEYEREERARFDFYERMAKEHDY